MSEEPDAQLEVGRAAPWSGFDHRFGLGHSRLAGLVAVRYERDVTTWQVLTNLVEHTRSTFPTLRWIQRPESGAITLNVIGDDLTINRFADPWRSVL